MTATAANLEAVRSALSGGLASLGVPLEEATLGRLLQYLELMQKWNRVYNLTAVRDMGAMVHQHVLDSLSVLPWMVGERVVDVGSGAGLPGIPIALAKPHLSVTLLDSADKRTAFLRQAAAELGLGNVEIVRERVEAWRPPQGYDVAVARAFAELGEFVSRAKHLVRAGGRLIAMKGTLAGAELKQLGPGTRVVEVVPVAVPGLQAVRHVVVIATEGEA